MAISRAIASPPRKGTRWATQPALPPYSLVLRRTCFDGWHGQAIACPCRRSDEHGQTSLPMPPHAIHRLSCDRALVSWFRAKSGRLSGVRYPGTVGALGIDECRIAPAAFWQIMAHLRIPSARPAAGSTQRLPLKDYLNSVVLCNATSSVSAALPSPAIYVHLRTFGAFARQTQP